MDLKEDSLFAEGQETRQKISEKEGAGVGPAGQNIRGILARQQARGGGLLEQNPLLSALRGQPFSVFPDALLAAAHCCGTCTQGCAALLFFVEVSDGCSEMLTLTSLWVWEHGGCPWSGSHLQARLTSK